VSQGSIDHLLGIVQAKQFLAANLTSQSVDLKALLLQPLYVPESMRALRVLELFKKSGNHMAMIVDEYGVIQGLVTLNDILEAIVGDFPAANEPEESQAIQQPDGSWLLDGMLPIEEFKEIFNLRKLSEGEGINYQTLGGFVMMQLGDVPATADQFEWENLRFEVIDMDAHRVDKVLVTPVQVPSDG
jgi:putative hemolysin